MSVNFVSLLPIDPMWENQRISVKYVRLPDVKCGVTCGIDIQPGKIIFLWYVSNVSML